ncbi:hypothetical protein CGZ65_00355 [Neisseria weixii]|nr:hypothetical protein CGZ65_00355 [Neisseria weixii]
MSGVILMPIAVKERNALAVPIRHTQSIKAIRHQLQKKTGRHPKAGRRLRKNFLKLLHRYILRNRPVVCSDGS